jgi:hypothetical protein
VPLQSRAGQDRADILYYAAAHTQCNTNTVQHTHSAQHTHTAHTHSIHSAVHTQHTHTHTPSATVKVVRAYISPQILRIFPFIFKWGPAGTGRDIER